MHGRFNKLANAEFIRAGNQHHSGILKSSSTARHDSPCSYFGGFEFSLLLVGDSGFARDD